MNGKLIVLEGIDGSGKATQSGLLEDHLIKSGKDVMHISFPGLWKSFLGAGENVPER